MQEIKCPKCGEIFLIDETGYAEIVKQVRDKEFEGELSSRVRQFEREKAQALELARVEQHTAVLEAVTDLKKQLSDQDHRYQLKIAELQSKIDRKDSENELVLEKLRSENEITVQKIKSDYNAQIKAKDEMIEYYKDLKLRQSTKMLGETLEQHCEVEFNRLRAVAFPNAYFEKDNDAKDGTKGDYIFRESDETGAEIISIMFEMKNEADETATKHKNDDFLKKLNDDRNKKGCEYAVLVSMLEQDNELYNQGIVDKSYKYPKMYVVRPQFFIPIISLLRNAALNSMAYKHELILARNQSIDITNFEKKLNDFKQDAGRNYELAGRHFGEAIDNIDKTIKTLTKIKESLEKSVNNLRIASDKAEGLTIKRLTKDNPTMQKLFAGIEDEV